MLLLYPMSLKEKMRDQFRSIKGIKWNGMNFKVTYPATIEDATFVQFISLSQIGQLHKNIT